MENKDQKNYIILSILLLAAILGIAAFVILPRYLAKPPQQPVDMIDFSSSAWIEDYLDQSVGFHGNDFYINSAFTYNLRSNKMITTYATQLSVEELREHYLSLPGGDLAGRNDETSLSITASLQQGDLRVYNYYSPISRVVEIELTLTEEESGPVISQLEEAFPAEAAEDIPQLSDLIAGEVFGGYVRYRYDELDEFNYPFIPIYSRAFVYSGTEEDYQGVIDQLREANPDFRTDETSGTDYYRIEGQIVSVSLFTTDQAETVVSVSFQEDRGE